MQSFILAVHIIVAIAMISLILIQHGKGADAGASFGAGASGTVFGASGTANFLTRTTAVLTAIFFATSLYLAIQAREQASGQLTLDVPTETNSATEAPTQNTQMTHTETAAPADTSNASDNQVVDNQADNQADDQTANQPQPVDESVAESAQPTESQ